jgi:Asp-tRNA(Asn)/Glu-tRNA(Gln) amidotransferase A subunit family amidase
VSAGLEALAGTIASGRALASYVIRAALDRAHELEGQGAIWALNEEDALRAAHEVDAAVDRGEHPGPLAAVPFGVKDCIDVAGLRTTAGISDRTAPARSDAQVVARLRAAGAIPLAKTAMDQLGWTTDGTAPGFAPCLNPLDPSRSPGGSSAGSAAAVASGIVPFALGTDTAGSVRVPASYCGLVGLAPSAGTLPLAGTVSIVPSFDRVGVMAASVADARLALATAAGADPAASGGARRVRVGRLDDLMDAAEPRIAFACRRALEGAPPDLLVEPARLDWRPLGLGKLLAVELAGTWGSRVERSPDAFTRTVRESVAIGRRIAPAELDAASAALRDGATRAARELGDFDAVACPTVPHAVPAARAARVADTTLFTRIFSALDWAAVTIPCGADPRGMPIGLQLASRPERMDRLLTAAAALER